MGRKVDELQKELAARINALRRVAYIAASKPEILTEDTLICLDTYLTKHLPLWRIELIEKEITENTPLENLTKAALCRICKLLGIVGVPTMTSEQLLKLIKKEDGKYATAYPQAQVHGDSK